MKSSFENYTNEKLLQLIINYHNKYGKTPPANYMKSKNGFPSIRMYYKRFNTNSWIDILQLCNLKPQYRYYSKEEGLSMLKKNIQRIGHIPTQHEYMNLKLEPSYSWFIENFKGMKEALKNIGLLDNELSDEDKLVNSIEFFEKLGNKLIKCPTRKEYEFYRNKDKTLNLITVLKKLNINLAKLNYKYFPQYFKEVKKYDEYSEQEIVSNIKKYMLKNHSIPEAKQLSDIYDYSLNYFARVHNGYENFLIKHKIVKYKRRKNKTEKELLEDFYRLAIKLNRIPFKGDIDISSNTASWKTYMSKFESIENICKKLNITEMYDNNIKKCASGHYHLYTNGKRLCKSVPEYRITTLFEINNIKFEKEYRYDYLIKNSNYIFDWKITINNKDYYIEYFGLYNNKGRSKLKYINKYTETTKKKIKLLYKHNLINNCIFLYPKNYKTVLINILMKLEVEKLDSSPLYDNIDNTNITDEDILNQLMRFSDNKNKLPSYSTILKNNLYKYYRLILKRYNNYENFAIKFNKKTWKREKSRVTAKNILTYAEKIIEKYGKIISQDEFSKMLSKDEKNQYRGYVHYIESHGGFMMVKLNLLDVLLKNNINIRNDKQYLIKVSNRTFPFSGVEEEKSLLATKIIKKYNILDNWGDKNEFSISNTTI